MVYNIKAGLAAGASLAGTAMAYKNSQKGHQNGSGKQSTMQIMVASDQGIKKGGKSHEEAMKQMQMWKF